MSRMLALWLALWVAIVYFLYRPKLGWRSLFWSKDKKIKLQVLRQLQAAGLDAMRPGTIAQRVKRSEAEVAEALQTLREEGLAVRGNDLGILFSWAPEQWAATGSERSTYQRPRLLHYFISKVSS